MIKSFHNQILLEAMSPIAHHSSVDGNHANLNRQLMRLADGSFGRVPTITPDTMRNLLRRLSSAFLLQACGIGEGQLTQSALRLLFNGGTLTGKGDASVIRIDQFRELERIVPTLSLLGGCVNSMMIPGRLEVETAILVCDETRHIVPQWATDHVGIVTQARIPSYREQTDEVMRVRMDSLNNPQMSRYLTDGERKLLGERLDAREKAHDKGDDKGAAEAKSSMMPRTMEVICQGSYFSWEVTGRFHSDIEEAAWKTTLCLLRTPEARVGGKKGTGHGRIRIEKVNDVIVPRGPQAVEEMRLSALDSAAEAKMYVKHLEENAAKIREFLTKVDA